MRENMLILLGKTCSGKLDIQRELSNLGIPRILEYTTRPPGMGEENGGAYHFISEREFYSLYRRGFFAVTISVKACGGEVWHDGVAEKDLVPYSTVIGNPANIHRLRGLYFAKPIVFYIDTDENVIYEEMKNRYGSIYEAQRRIVREREAFSSVEHLADYRIGNDGCTETEVLAREIKNLYQFHVWKTKE